MAGGVKRGLDCVSSRFCHLLDFSTDVALRGAPELFACLECSFEFSCFVRSLLCCGLRTHHYRQRNCISSCCLWVEMQVRKVKEVKFHSSDVNFGSDVLPWRLRILTYVNTSGNNYVDHNSLCYLVACKGNSFGSLASFLSGYILDGPLKSEPFRAHYGRRFSTTAPVS